jgi:hypothetical protein
MKASRSSYVNFQTLTLCHCATLGSSINTLSNLVACTSHLRTASGYLRSYGVLLLLQAYQVATTQGTSVYQQCLGDKTALDGAAVHFFLALCWCDSPIQGLFVPESIDIFFTVGSSQRSTLSGDDCAASPEWHTSLGSLAYPGLFRL